MLRNRIKYKAHKMFNVARNVCVLQNVCNKNLTGILQNKISSLISVEKLFYSSGAKKMSEKLNPNLKNGDNSDDKSTEAKKKNLRSPKITVLSTDSKLTVMTLEEAQKLSKRRDLKLVKVINDDHKTQRPVYKLMTGAEYFQEDLIRRKEKKANKNEESKDPKLLTLSAKIGDHDLGSKIKSIVKWLNKRHEVRIVINIGSNEEAAELVCKKIETETKALGKLVQKRRKDDNLKFQLVSLRKKSDDTEEKSSSESDCTFSAAES